MVGATGSKFPSRVVSIEASPEPITIDTATTAAIVVDMQNDFCTKGGMFDQLGIDVSAMEGAVERTSRVLACARESGICVIYLKMGFRPDLSDLGGPDSPNRIKHRTVVGKAVAAPDGRPSRILIRDTWNTDIVDELRPRASDILIYKTRYSGFYETELDTILRGRGARSLIMTGVSTSVCVESTLRDAMYRDYRCLLLSDCASEPVGKDLSRSNHDASLLVIEELFGWTSTSAELIRSLGGLEAPGKGAIRAQATRAGDQELEGKR
jgi:ureidoacrylate peracid hydrolase